MLTIRDPPPRRPRPIEIPDVPELRWPDPGSVDEGLGGVDDNGSLFDRLRDAYATGSGILSGGVAVAGAVTGAGALAARLLKAVPEAVLAQAIQAGFDHLLSADLSTRGGRSRAVGKAVEVIAERLVKHQLGTDSPGLVDLNDLKPNAPVVDLAARDTLYSIKTRGLAGAGPPPAGAATEKHVRWESSTFGAYGREFRNIVADCHPKAPRKRAKLARLIRDNVDLMRERGALVNELPGEPDQADVLSFIRRRTNMLVPSDHHRRAQDFAARALLKAYQQGKLDLEGIPQGLSDEAIAPTISSLVGRIQPMDVSSKDLRALLDVARRHPEVQRRFNTFTRIE